MKKILQIGCLLSIISMPIVAMDISVFDDGFKKEMNKIATLKDLVQNATDYQSEFIKKTADLSAIVNLNRQEKRKVLEEINEMLTKLKLAEKESLQNVEKLTRIAEMADQLLHVATRTHQEVLYKRDHFLAELPSDVMHSLYW